MKLVFDESCYDEFVLTEKPNAVFGNANLSNLSKTLLEGNKDHLMNYARTDPARRKNHFESVNKCIGDLQKRTEEQSREPQDV